MNSRFSFPLRVWLAVSPVLFGSVLITVAASGKNNASLVKPDQSAVVTNAPTAPTEVPISVFVMPATEKDGKDPFFPRSPRPYAIPNVPALTNQVPVVSDLRINGTSGSEERPLVIINNVTFGIGDSGEVISGGRRIRVQCLEINLSEGTATIQVAGQQRILRFQKSKN